MANACVSHEMRNPLNSINAINLMKRQLYKRIDLIANELKHKDLHNIQKELEDGMKIQDDSLTMLIFIV